MDSFPIIEVKRFPYEEPHHTGLAVKREPAVRRAICPVVRKLQRPVTFPRFLRGEYNPGMNQQR